MFDLIPFGALSAQPDPLVSFVERHLEGLGHAASLLGGRAGAELVRDLAERLSRPGERSRGTEQRLDRLEDLLSLEGVHCEDTVEEAAFASIDPMNPFVEEVCLLVDGLRDARRRAAKQDERRETSICIPGALILLGRDRPSDDRSEVA